MEFFEGVLEIIIYLILGIWEKLYPKGFRTG